MATLIGQDDLPVSLPGGNARVSANVLANRPWLGTPVDVGIVTEAGARGFVQISLLPASARSGVNDKTFRDDWYGRFHLLPTRYFDAGNMIGASITTFSIWNAWFASKSLTSLSATGDDGLILGGISAPSTFVALEEKNFTLAITTSGPPTIDAHYVFGFSSGETLTLVVVGTRIIVFSIRPDWSSGVLEVLEWASDVLIAWDGTEQRVRLRAHPRRSFEFSILADGVSAQALEALIYGWGGRSFCVPVWTDRSILASPILAGADTLNLSGDISTHDYHANGLIVLLAGDTKATAAEILSIAGNVLTLKRPLGNSWPAGTRVYPGAVMRLDGAAKLDRVTNRIMSARVRFVDAAYTSLTAAEPDGQTYQGVPLFLWRPDWAQAYGDEIGRPANVLDYTTGLVAVDDITGRAHPVRRMGFLLESRARIKAARSWLAARAGRMHPCWMPTWSDDLTITRDINMSDAGLYVAAAGMSRFWPDPLRRDVLIRTTQGNFLRRVTSITVVSATEESVSLDTPLGVDIPRANIISVHWLNLSRLDADRVELHWETDEAAILNLTTAVLPS
jgi:hypothetical protein